MQRAGKRNAMSVIRTPPGRAPLNEAPPQTTQPAPSCSKAAAVALYCHGLLPLERVAAMFRANPEWRSA